MTESLHTRVWNDVAGIRHLNELRMLDKLRKQDSLVRRLVRKTQDGTLGTATDDQEPEEMLQVGDNLIMQQPAQGLGKWAQAAAIAAGLVAAGGLGGLATKLLLDAPAAVAPASVSPAVPATDLDTQYELRLVD